VAANHAVTPIIIELKYIARRIRSKHQKNLSIHDILIAKPNHYQYNLCGKFQYF